MSLEKNFDFSPKKYLKGQITCDCCNHELLSKSAFDEGIVASYTCLVCGKKFEHISNDLFEQERFINYNVGPLTKYNDDFFKAILNFVCTRYRDEDNIDIVDIFNKIKPDLTNITLILNKPTIMEREKVLKKYSDLCKKDKN